MRIHTLTPEQALASLNSSASGLDAREAARRLVEYGPNHLQEVEREHLLLRFAQEFTHFFAVILWIAAALAFIAEHFDPAQGMARLGVAIVGVVVVNGIFSFWQEYKAERAVAALRQLLPQKARVLRDGEISDLLASEIVPGDVVLLEEGDFVPADCRLLTAFGLRVNLSTVTGESFAKPRSVEVSGEESPLHARNLVLAGTSVVSGQAQAVAYATGMRTEFGRIAHLTQTAGETSSPLQREIARLSRLVACLATGIGVALFVVGQAIGLPPWENLLFTIGIIVANVPEGLLPTVTLSLAMATQRMARRNALVRHLPAVEALGSTTVICSDKTGTLTQNRMSVHRLWIGGGFVAPSELESRRHLTDEHYELFVNAALCHDLKTVEEAGRTLRRGDPMELALEELGRRIAGARVGHARIDEIPFDTDRKRMSVLIATPQGRVLYTKGALETVLACCRFVHFDAGIAVLDPAVRTRLLAAQDEMASAGLRVLAFAHRALADDGTPIAEDEMTFAGLIGLEDPPRAEVPEAIARCEEAGIRILMVTGDHPRTGLAIARQIGLVRGDQPVIVTGEQLRLMSPTQLQLALDAPEILFARVAAEQKMLIVDALKKKGEVVAVTGDGVNDAPALKTADIGIAMGIAGTDVAKAAADLILLDDNFASIVAAIEEGRAVFDNLRKFLTYILSSNIPELVPYLAFVLFRVPLPLTVIQILAVDLGTDMLPALALGAERPEAGVMKRPPRASGERLLSWGLVARAYLFLGVLQAAAAMAVFFIVLGSAGWHYGESIDRLHPLYLQATSACLMTIVVMQAFNVYLCRHPERSLFTYGVSGNPSLALAVVAELVVIALIVYSPAGNWLFGTAPIEASTWWWAVAGALLMAAAEEARKAIFRAHRSRHP